MGRSLDDNRSPSLRETTINFGGAHATRSLWEARIRWTFLSICTVCGAVLAYTTRHFVNGDALTYFDMADAFGRGLWAELVNLHYSPGSAVLLGIVMKVLGLAPSSEVFAAKAVNFLCYVCALLALEVLLVQIETDEEFSSSNSFQRTPWIAFRAAAYGLFLVSSLIYVRIQVISPDMLVFCFTLLVAAVLVWIKKSAESYVKFVVLGLVTGVGYLCKTLFFPMTAVFVAFSALYCASVRKALPRVLVAMVVFLIVSAPLFMAISMRLGRFSFGESGNYNYSHFVSKKGSPTNIPERIWNRPQVDVYSGQSAVATYPSGFDLSFWNEGVSPSFDLHAQISVLFQNVIALIDFSPYLYLAFLIWLCYQTRIASSFSVNLRPPSLSILFGVIAVAGTGLFCLVLFEPRYFAPFVFLGFTALLLWPQYRLEAPGTMRAVQVGSALITAVMVAMVLVGIWDQSVRALSNRGAQLSHLGTFFENVAVKDFLSHRGVTEGHLVAIAGTPSSGIYWARLSGVKATGSIADHQEFLAISTQDRQRALNALKTRGFDAIVAGDQSFAGLQQEGWCHVPGTHNFFVRFLVDGLQNRFSP
jgi:hypothetical protein